VLETNVLRGKLQDVIGQGAPSSGLQVHARHILVETEEKAREVKARLDKGEDFAAIAKEASTDTSNKDQGGDLGWFPPGQMGPEFDAAAFSLPINVISDPIQTSFGFRIIQVLERAENRPYDAGQVRQQQAKAFQDWLEAQRAPEAKLVEEMLTPERGDWAAREADRESAKVLR